ncbi:ABC transporter permease [Bacillus sp. ISL-40]|uniref:ABC transporter permease n=1 Tax=unclassified Bacillus (in: firmicutes) TaxID=185979 RepID=UPI001BE6834A|nr:MULTISPECIES: ABC transporter permease [unclassified Bacillus (in: firmicutes)]MBT2699101.1 ABC transporter permease [Bacillus sp. ISL-40]MBT2743975.1 ABC transporter permease [Bacillus sp. ISL-77]
MKDILWLIQNTLRVTFRKKKNIIMYLCMPLIGIFISLLVYGGDQKTILHVGIVNQDTSKITTDTIQFLKRLENVEISKITTADVQDQISSGDLDSVITFEKGYSDSVLAGEPDHIQLTSIKGAAITAYVKSYLHQYIDNIATISYVAGGNQQTFEQMYQDYQQTDYKLTTNALEDSSKNKFMTNQTIGFLIMIMLMSACNMSEIILLEKENRTYFRLLSTPINARKYIFSNVMVNMIVMTIQVLITLTIMKSIFDIGINMSFWSAAFVMLLFSLISVGISLVIVSFSNSRSAAGALQNLIITPTVMLSGCFWPVEVMPKSLQKIANFLPQRWTLDTLTKLQEGNEFSGLYLNFMILFAFAAAFFLIAVYRFSRNNSTQTFV